MIWTDASGRSLADYPRPSLAVDVALLTVAERSLCVVLHRPDDGYAAGKWALPGTFVREHERLADAALRALADKAGVVGEAPEQLGAFDEPGRDARGRVISVAHVDLVPRRRLGAVATALIDGVRAVIPGRQRKLPFDHDEIVAGAVLWARARYAAAPDPSRLLGEEFTLFELRRLHEAIQGPATPAKDTFRRRMEPLVEPTGRWATGTVGKPAQLYRRA